MEFNQLNKEIKDNEEKLKRADKSELNKKKLLYANRQISEDNIHLI